MKISSLLASTLIGLVVSCGGSSSGTPDSSGGNHDGTVGHDGTVADSSPTADAPSAPAMITISGVTSELTIGGLKATAAITVTAFKSSDDSMLGSAVSDGSGNYSITVATGGVALDGYLTAAKGTTYVPAYIYPPKVLTADFPGAPVEVVTSSTLGLAYTVAQVSQTAADGTLGIVVHDATGAEEGSATVTATLNGSADGTIRYVKGSTPDKTATATDASGTALVMNALPGTVAVTAAKTGVTFTTHDVKVIAGAISETIVEP